MTVYEYPRQINRNGQPTVAIRRRVVNAGFDTPEKISEWAAKRGLLSIYISPVEVTPGLYTWQIMKHNGLTDPDDIRYGGNKTFFVGKRKYSSMVLQQAMDWASAQYNVKSWKKPIFASAWFPYSTIKELNLWLGIKAGRPRAKSE